MDLTQASTECESVLEEISGAVICDRDFLETILVGVVGRGHVLLEDVPGVIAGADACLMPYRLDAFGDALFPLKLVEYLAGKLGLEDAIDRIKRQTHRFARQQHTWFKTDDGRIRWLDGSLPLDELVCQVIQQLR